jgi:DNA-binding CsgD family transcriptional regulator
LLRADIELVRGRILYVHGGDVPGHASLLAAAERVRSFDADRAAAMLIEASWAAVAVAELDVALRAADRAVELAGDADGDLGLAAAFSRAVSLILLGRAPEAKPLLQRAKAVIADATALPPTIAGTPNIAALYFTVEDYGFAEVLLARFLAAARTVAAPEPLPHILGCLADLEFRIGRWASGYAHATEAVQVAATIGQEGTYPYALVHLARIEAGMGRDEARAHAHEAEVLATRRGYRSTRPYALAALGLLDLAVGDIEAAIVALEEVDRTMRQWGVGDPYAVQWMPDLVEAYSRAGRRREMEALLVRLAEQAKRTEGTWAQAAAARCRGMGADDFEEHFERALALHDLTPTPFERARTELAYGERLRRAGRRAESRVHLRSALETFERLGAAPWRDRTAAELGVSVEHMSSGRQGIDRLSPQELQVALLVADGATNREVAAALFVTTKTVEFHLRNIYRKLSIRSRTELARTVAEGATEPRQQAPGT